MSLFQRKPELKRPGRVEYRGFVIRVDPESEHLQFANVRVSVYHKGELFFSRLCEGQYNPDFFEPIEDAKTLIDMQIAKTEKWQKRLHEVFGGDPHA